MRQLQAAEAGGGAVRDGQCVVQRREGVARLEWHRRKRVGAVLEPLVEIGPRNSKLVDAVLHVRKQVERGARTVDDRVLRERKRLLLLALDDNCVWQL